MLLCFTVAAAPVLLKRTLLLIAVNKASHLVTPDAETIDSKNVSQKVVVILSKQRTRMRMLKPLQPRAVALPPLLPEYLCAGL